MKETICSKCGDKAHIHKNKRNNTTIIICGTYDCGYRETKEDN